MTRQELPKREERATRPKVLRANGNFFVESLEGCILYKVFPGGDGTFSCTCGDYGEGIKNNPLFECKHILAVLHFVPKGDVEEGEFLENRKPRLDERFIKTIEGKEFVLYSGLLDLAHQKGLCRLEADPLQYPTQENGNMAICKAVGISKAGETFTDVGDANPLNCSAKVTKHLLRVASTRAKARVLRDMTNIGMTCLEELADLNEVLGTESPEQSKSKLGLPKMIFRPKAFETRADKGNGSNGGPKKQGKSEPEKAKPRAKHEPGSMMSSAQKNAICNLSRRRGISGEELEKMAEENFGIPLDNLSVKNASTFICTLQRSKPGTPIKNKSEGQEKAG